MQESVASYGVVLTGMCFTVKRGCSSSGKPNSKKIKNNNKCLASELLEVQELRGGMVEELFRYSPAEELQVI